MKAVRDVFANESVADKLIAVYCIAGCSRSGKSFVLDLFLKYLLNGGREDWIDVDIEESFKYSNSEDRVATGIWIWSEPIIRKDREGNDIAVFLMDTQGWHDSRQPKRDDELIFELSTLLSSVILFNVEKRINEDVLFYLQNLTSTAHALGEMDDQPFQRLVFLVRDWLAFDVMNDFPYGYYDSQRPTEFRDFIQYKWEPSGRSEQDNKIRKMISLLYERICAYLMPNPGKIIYYNKFDGSKIDNEFKDHLVNFCSILFDEGNIVPNQFNGVYLKGMQLFELIKGKWSKDFKLDLLKPRNEGPDESVYRLAY